MRLVLYMAAPLRPNAEELSAHEHAPDPGATAYQANIKRAMRWLAWLRRSFPGTTFIAPWIASVLAGADEHDPTQRAAGLIDDCAVVARCDGIVLVGGRESSGMTREAAHSARCWDLTGLGDEPPTFEIGHIPFEYWAQAFLRKRTT